MKQHLSEPRPGAETVMEKRAHADRCKTLPKDLPDDVDLMIEVSDVSRTRARMADYRFRQRTKSKPSLNYIGYSEFVARR